jgi:hypothetical protein
MEAKRIIFGLGCTYEAVAVLTRRTPTISSICWRRRVVVPVVLGAIGWHLLSPPETSSDIVGQILESIAE